MVADGPLCVSTTYVESVYSLPITYHQSCKRTKIYAELINVINYQTALILGAKAFGSKLCTESLNSTSCSVNPSLGPMERFDLKSELVAYSCPCMTQIATVQRPKLPIRMATDPSRNPKSMQLQVDEIMNISAMIRLGKEILSFKANGAFLPIKINFKSVEASFQGCVSQTRPRVAFPRKQNYAESSLTSQCRSPLLSSSFCARSSRRGRGSPSGCGGRGTDDEAEKQLSPRAFPSRPSISEWM